jgi:hypothetical protein
MKTLIPLALALLFAGCATPYQSEGFLGGFSDVMTAPDEAVVVFHGNGYTSAERVVEMAALRCAEITLAHGYRYFVGTGVSDVSRQSSFTTPGYASTYGHVSEFGTVIANTTITPPQTFNFYKPGLMVSIKMSNDERSLESVGMTINGQQSRPRDAVFLSQSLRQHLGVKLSIAVKS